MPDAARETAGPRPFPSLYSLTSFADSVNISGV